MRTKNVLLLSIAALALLIPNFSLAQQVTIMPPLQYTPPTDPTKTMLTFAPARLQTGNQTEWRDQFGNIKSRVGPTGDFTFSNPTTLTLPNGIILSANGANAWDGMKFTKSVTVGPTVGNEAVNSLFEINRTAAIPDQAVITALEAVARSRSAGTNLTIRGANIRTYVDDALGGTAITSVAIDGSARASGAVVAAPGTAFVGIRSYMAPGFTGGTLGNVTNFHAFWAYNESATQAVTNVLYASAAAGGFTNGLNFTGTTLTNEAIYSNGMTLGKSGANAWDGLTLTKTNTVPIGGGNESVAIFTQVNKENNDAAVVTQTAVEGVSRSRGTGAETTLRGGHFRTYIDDTTGGTAITSVGVDGSARASGAVAADAGTAFVGVRAYMAPGFTGPTLANVTNFHAFWAYNESAAQAVTNVLYASAAAGGFTNGVNLSGTTIAATGGQVIFSNGVYLYTGVQTTRDGVRGEVGLGGAIGSTYYSTAGKQYVKVANANATADWERVTTSAAD